MGKEVAWASEDGEMMVAYTAEALEGMMANPSRLVGTVKAQDLAEAAVDVAAEMVHRVNRATKPFRRQSAVVAFDVLALSALAGTCASSEFWGGKATEIATAALTATKAAYERLVEHLPAATKRELQDEEDDEEDDDDDEEDDDEDEDG